MRDVLQTTMTEDSQLSYAVVGAGPSGLALSRAFSLADIPHTIYEKHSDVGGIWNIDNAGSPMYESAHFISSKWTSGFVGYPMPETLADYPSYRDVLEYLKDFSNDFGLTKNVAFNSEVISTKRTTAGWALLLKNGEVKKHRGLICANGVTWLPSLPKWPGNFTGEIRHSGTYRSADEFRGKRVLIVGLGNSGADIACDAARNAVVSAVSVRRGYHFLPKQVYGWPIDVFFRRPDILPEALRSANLRAGIAAATGDPGRLGMPRPDHEFGQAHPLLNTQLLHHLAHGDISVRPDIKRLDGNRVVFTDGSSMEVDLILAATGYQVKAPYVDDQFFEFKGGRIAHYLNVFNHQDHELFTVGFAEVAAGIYPLIDQMAHVLAQHLKDRQHDQQKAREFEELKLTDTFDLKAGKSFVASDRHANYVDLLAYKDHVTTLCERFGWPNLNTNTYESLRRSAA